MKYEKAQIDRLNKIEAIKLRDGSGNNTNWLTVNNVPKENGLKEIITNENFSFYYNMLERVNGYTNVFTYMLAIEIDSDQDKLDMFRSIAELQGVYECEKQMKEYYQNEMPTIPERSLETILHIGLDCVNFTELAHKMAEYNEN